MVVTSLLETDSDNYHKISKFLHNGTKSEKKIARYLLSNFPYSVMEGMKAISLKTEVSIPTIQRLVVKLGFEGFPDFKKSVISASQAEQKASPLSRMQETSKQGRQQKHGYLQTIKNIETTFANLPNDLLLRSAEILADESRPVWCLGGRFTGNLTRLFARHLKTIRKRVREHDYYEGSLADVYVNTESDTVLFVTDIRRYDAPIVELCRMCKGVGATIILVTDNWHSPAEKYADVVIPVYTTSPSGWDSNACLMVVLEEIMGILTAILGVDGRSKLSKREQFLNQLKEI